MNERKETAQLIAETLQAHGFKTWATPGGINIRTNASIKETRNILSEVDYPQHLVRHNSSYAKGAIGEFSTLVKTS